MKIEKSPYELSSAVLPVVIAVALLWVIQSAGVLFDLPLNTLGVIPREWARLYGVATSALVHGSYEHLFNNTLPLVVLGAMVRYGYPNSRGKVLLMVWLVSGAGVWLFGRESVHLGASGISHGLFFFLFIVSLLRKDRRSAALMMIAFLMYGGMIMTIFPRDPGISFEAHFFGAVGGVASALLFWRRDPKHADKRYAWQDEELNDTEDPVIGDLWKQAPYPEATSFEGPAPGDGESFSQNSGERRPHGQQDQSQRGTSER
ncbi:rhomboid family intramembrane serine protease [Alteromonas gilva]|uniref:Rhomboid family intramembrane serine protease n=1 Tax=Alteromonas gilva TaxID=2987522 RepID=A0ABT5L425_9ALTE|nr:rhomboid family intramembrane serine protease [Alteromonas gilva]MDC8831189.1 rhomboid family intramembrane serine protease [Alteromonas gilva]